MRGWVALKGTSEASLSKAEGHQKGIDVKWKAGIGVDCEDRTSDLTRVRRTL